MTRATNIFTRARAPKLTVGERMRSIPKPKPVMLVPSSARVMRVKTGFGNYLLVDPSTMREVLVLGDTHHRLGSYVTMTTRQRKKKR